MKPIIHKATPNQTERNSYSLNFCCHGCCSNTFVDGDDMGNRQSNMTELLVEVERTRSLSEGLSLQTRYAMTLGQKCCITCVPDHTRLMMEMQTPMIASPSVSMSPPTVVQGRPKYSSLIRKARREITTGSIEAFQPKGKPSAWARAYRRIGARIWTSSTEKDSKKMGC